MELTCRKFTIVQDGKPKGPFGLDKIYSLLKKGQIDGATLCAAQGSEQWGTIDDIREDIATYENSPTRFGHTPEIVPGATILETDGSDQSAQPDWPSKLHTGLKIPSQTSVRGVQVPCMAILGCWSIFGGVIGCVFFFLMSVDVPAGDILQRVSNLGLMNTRVCGMIASVGLTLLGGLLLVVDAIKTRP